MTADRETPTAMCAPELPPRPGADVRLVIVGAGQINFGSPEGPWNHSIRLERKLGPRLHVVALIDPVRENAEKVLRQKRASSAMSSYRDTAVYPDMHAYLATVTPDTRPHVVWIGSPPAFRGSMHEGRDIEKMLADALPGVGVFLEKPVSTSSVGDVMDVDRYIDGKLGPVSVGYMLRYLRVSQKLKQIISDNRLRVMAVNARYVIAYEHLTKQWWWNKSQSLGPVIEQATHFCDLARYFGGEVELDSIIAHSLEHFEPPSGLSKLAFDEEACIPAEERVPRVTSATWKYESGAVGSLMHVIALHGRDFFTEIDVFADGYSLRLCDAYNAPVLYVRRPGDDREEVYKYDDDDPFFSEVAGMIDAVEDPSQRHRILTSYDDAARTYAFTWAIRRASEACVAARHRSP